MRCILDAIMTTFLCPAILALLMCISLAAQGSVAGEWVITVHDPFGADVSRLVLVVNGDALTGTVRNRKIEGTVKGAAIEFKLDNAVVKGTLEGDEVKDAKGHTRAAC
jgi:hypothetical protein